MKKMYKNIASCLSLMIFLLGSWQSQAQISFSNANNLLESSNFHSGVAIGVVDMNNDGLDDILRLDDARVITIEYQEPGQNFIPYSYGSVSNQNEWAMAAGDVNNDGFNAVMVGGYTNTKLAVRTPDNSSFTHDVLPGDGFFVQGSNFADINNDGFLDIFNCNDDGESGIWSNNGDGTFSEADDWIDMATTPVSDNSGNYGSIWTDFDNDGDLDLYIAKCRQGVDDSTDPRRINALFVNDGENNYTEQAKDFGLKIGWQSWTADFNDFDNDGDFDAFITNHDFPNQLLENDGAGHFSDISTGQNIGLDYIGLPIQGVMRDFDNDGFVDILVTGTRHTLYRNQGDGTFQEIDPGFDNNDIESFAIGDLNNDGFLDIYAGYANIYTNPSNIEDVIWMNNTNSNNWFGLNLEGTVSNRNAVGARVEIYGDWGVQVREVRAGESYGIMNSFKVNFGLGTSTGIDHVVVKWPSGIINVIDNPTINAYLDLVEAQDCDPFIVDVTTSGNTIICEGESVDLIAPAGYNYLWSNGMTSSQITVSTTGGYSVLVQDLTTGCYGISQNLAIQNEPDETPEITIEGDLEFCAGQSVVFTSSEAVSYNWSNGEMTQSITVSEPGTYSVEAEGFCGTFNSESYTVEVYESELPTALDVEISEPGPATLMATGSNPQWYDAEIGGNLLGTGSSLEIPNLEIPTTYWVSNITEFGEPDMNTGMTDHSGTDFDGPGWNSGIRFNAMSPLVIKSVKVYTDTEGERLIELHDAGGNILADSLVNIPETGDEGMVINLNFEVPEGVNYSLRTNQAQNNAALGSDSPRLRRSNQGVDYDDYFVEDLINVTNSLFFDNNRYYYFFDLVIESPSFDCESERIPVFANILTSTTSIENSPEIQIFPNPTYGQINLNLDFDQSTEVSFVITDVTGKNVYTENIGRVSGQENHELNLSHLAKGIYLIQVATPEHTYFGKIAIQ